MSKLLSLVLRHHPERLHLTLDENGWASVDDLVQAAGITPAQLQQVVQHNDKKRFVLSEDGRRIRAVQGHSLAVDLQYEPATPPPSLFHGTHVGALPSILAQGLCKQGRQFVHLSPDPATASRVGLRHGKPLVLEVNTTLCQSLGLTFFLAPNGVWLTDHVPAAALSVHPKACESSR